MKEQQSECGELYWRRSHQLPGLAFCKRHSCFLENSPIHYHPKEKHHFIAAATTPVYATAKHIELSKLEEGVHDRYVELLEAGYLRGLGANRWTHYYRNLANELGFIHKSRVLHQEIFQLIKQRWAGSTFEHHFIGSIENHWLVYLFRKHRNSFHPFRHLLVLSALTPEFTVTELIAKVNGLPFSAQELVNNWQKSNVSEKDIKKHRRSWRALIKQNPGVGVKGLRDLTNGGAVYAWLYRNDLQWLVCNKPEYRPGSKRHYQTDYKHWDELNVVLLESAYEELARMFSRPRLTQSRFIKALPRANTVEKHLVDLPETTQWLASHAESVEDYQLYRLRAAYETINASHLEVKRWRLLRFANIRKELIT